MLTPEDRRQLDRESFIRALENEHPDDQLRMIADHKIEQGVAYAKRILVHYFTLALPDLDLDCRTEIELAVESLFEAAVEQGARWGAGRAIDRLSNGGLE